MKKQHKWIFIFLISLLLISCQNRKEHSIEFYHWKTSFSPTSIEQKYMEELGSRKLYLRFFDVDKEQGKIVPKAILKPFTSSLANMEYIPVIFITNRTLKDLPEKGIENVVDRIYSMIKEIEEKNSLPTSEEIQIDCDWTESTRKNYFRLLTLLQEKSERKISCTLRLHQIKFSQRTGIPPVSKGYLMCYATSDPSDTDTQNSILDLELLKEYTNKIEHYPLKFDIALPLYSWGVVINHLGKIKLINGVTREDMEPDKFIYLSDNVYEASQDQFFRGLYINKGFTIRIEEISPELLQQTKAYLDSKMKNNYTIVYYHLHEPFLNKFTLKELK